MKYPYFSTISKKTRQELGRQGGLKKQTLATKIAWKKSDEIKELKHHHSRRELARRYKVSPGTIQRIINS